MNGMENSLTCERAGDLVGVLYGEATEREAREFRSHVNECDACRAEFASFAQVRESIGEWRDEALTGFVASPVTVKPVRKSALAAWRQFFALSPLWLKGAVGFAAVMFCLFATLAVVRMRPVRQVPPTVAVTTDMVYTQADVDRIVKEALAKQQNASRGYEKQEAIAEVPPGRNLTATKAARITRASRPFSRAEREQLAADLRLVSAREEDVDLFGERINK